MTKKQFQDLNGRAARVIVVAPSELNPDFPDHGKVLIAMDEPSSDTLVQVYYTEGPVISRLIDPLYLTRYVSK